MKKLTILSLLAVFSSFSGQNFHQYVNPFIGTGGHGHTFPGATLPFGMVQLSPDTRIDGSWDGCSGYHYSDSTIYGFSHTHLNGVGVSDYGDIMLMPMMGEASLNNKVYSSKFSHEQEKAEAGYYQVKLLDDNIDVRLTATTRVGYHEYTFNQSGQANIILDLNHRDEVLEGVVRILDDTTVEVFRRSKAWATNQYIYAKIKFSKPLKVSKIENNGSVQKLEKIEQFQASLIEITGAKLGVAFSTNVQKNEKIHVKVSISPVSFEGAHKNMAAEGQSNDFESVRFAARKAWEKELSKIEVKSNDKDKLTIFYTALYHVFTQPNIYMDVDRKYRGRDQQIHTAEHFDYYTVFSLWDTFRGAHPLMTLLDKKRTSDFINTFITQYEQGGKLPVWELSANETECMIGYHAVPVIADAMVKGIKGFDYEKAFIAAKNSASLDIFGLSAYKEKNYIAVEDEHENVSKTLEYAYDDWCIAQMAQMLNKKVEYEVFMKRSQNWKNLFNRENGFMQPRKNGNWLQPFDAREVNNNYTEGNSWQYSFFVPQNINELIAYHGGKKKFEKFLDALFSAPQETTGRTQVDITGLIGQYAHGNEPSHHIAYLYNYVDQPQKTNEKVQFILENFYKNAPDGLIGNEDCGQMSAWYILSSMGIYSVTPGLPEWQTTTPLFDEIKIHLEDGTTRTIHKNTKSQTLKKIGFENIPQGKEFSYPHLVQTPIIKSKHLFDVTTTVELVKFSPKDDIYYIAIDEHSANIRKKFVKYSRPFAVDKTTKVNAYSVRNGQKSSTEQATLYKRPNFWDISIKSTYTPQYNAGGDRGLIDGIYGDENWRKGEWQGYQGQNFEAIINMKMSKTITEISSTYLQDSRSWILMPSKVEYYASSNGKDFFKLATISHEVDTTQEENSVKKFRAEVLPTKAQFIKVVAYNYGKLPEGHQGAGGEAYIFIDEIGIK